MDNRNRPTQGQPSQQDKDRKNSGQTNPQGKQSPGGQGKGAMHQGLGQTTETNRTKGAPSHSDPMKKQ